MTPAGGGTVTPTTGNWYDTGTVVTMTQQAATNYLFKWWRIDDGTTVETDASASIQVTMDKAKTVTGVFIYNLAQLQVEPTSASFRFLDSMEELLKQGTTQETDIVISNIGSGEVALAWQVGTITYVPAGSSGWASLAPTSGDLAAGETELAVLTVDRGDLPVGVYTATIPITSNGGTQNIAVTMTIANAPSAAIIYPTDENVAIETFLTFQAEFTSDSPIARSEWKIYAQSLLPPKGTSGGIPGYTLIYQTDITGPETTITAPWALFSAVIPNKGTGVYLWTVQCWESLADLPSEVATSDDFQVIQDQTYANQTITGQGLVDIQTAFAAVNPDVQAALNDVVDGETVVAAVSGGPTVFIRSLNPENVEGTNKPDNLDFFFDVRVEDVTPGGTAVVAIYLPGNHMGEEWYKYDSLLDLWYTYAGGVFNRTVTVGGETYTELLLTLVDGGAGDFDGAANGTIVDPSGSVTIPAGGEVRGGGGCFIATAAFGSYQEYHVWVLRQFRDNFLLTNTAGRAFVRWYYRHSPKYAAMIADNDGLRAVVRCVLLPVYGIAWLTLKLGAALWLLLAALGLAFALRRRMPAAAKLVVIAGIILVATPSFAVDFNHFKVAPGEQQFLVNSSAQSLKKGHLLTDVFYTYADKPGVVKVAGVDRDISKSQNIVMLSTAYAFTDKFQMSLFIPVLASQSSDSFFTGVKSSGLGNVTLAGKYSFCGGKDKIGCAVVPYVALPTGDSDNLISADSAAGGLKLVVDKNWDDRTFLTLNVGYWGQSKEDIGQISVENGLLFGAGISRILSNKSTSLTAEIYGRVDQGDKGTPVEAILAVGQQFKCAQLVIGGGAGLTDGYGAPEFRGFLGVKMDWTHPGI